MKQDNMENNIFILFIYHKYVNANFLLLINLYLNLLNYLNLNYNDDIISLYILNLLLYLLFLFEIFIFF